MIDLDALKQDVYQYHGDGFYNKVATGIATLDIALAGGVPLNGSIIEIYGEESHGKTTLTYRICKNCTREGGYVTWIDSELSYSSEWASVQGVVTDSVIPYRPPYMEACMDTIIQDIAIYKMTYLPWLVDKSWKPSREHLSTYGDRETTIEELTKLAPPHFIVWDSLAASPVKSVAEEGAEFSSGMAYRARLIKSFLSRYQVGVVGCENISLILINQVIDDIGSYGGGITTPGGRGLRHGKHLALYVKKSGRGVIDDDRVTVSDYVTITITKNKVTPVISALPVIFSKSRGFLGETSVLEYLKSVGWFTNAGSWKKFRYYEVNKSTGEISVDEEISFQESKFYTLLESRPELVRFLCEQIRTLFSEKFPSSKSLKEFELDDVVSKCHEEMCVSDPEEREEVAVSE